MQLSRKDCRCCGARRLFQRLPNNVVVDPFFARHGLQIEVDQSIDLPLYDWGLRRKVDALPARLSRALHRQLDRLRSKHVLTSLAIKIPYGLCNSCQFLAPWYEIGDDQLSDYYAHYLKEEYKQARTVFQPGFAELGTLMGSADEAESRRQQHQAYVMPHLLELRESAPDGQIRVLDYGGGEGMILPKLPWIKGTVHDVEGDQRSIPIEQPEFDFVQCLHVLEHVGNPLKTYQNLIRQCRRGGLIYIEVPSEFPEGLNIESEELPICHEHINKFCLQSIQGLQQASDVDTILIEAGEVDFLHLDGMTPVIRGIGRKL
jgi:SAM-dependent methyltransferase